MTSPTRKGCRLPHFPWFEVKVNRFRSENLYDLGDDFPNCGGFENWGALKTLHVMSISKNQEKRLLLACAGDGQAEFVL